MKLTSHDWDQLQTRRTHAEPPAPPKKTPCNIIPPEERERRRQIAIAAIEYCGGVSDLAMKLGASRSNVSKWRSGAQSVSTKHLARLEEMASRR